MNDPEQLALRVDRVGPSGASSTLTLLLLPAAATTADDFMREGFVEDLEAQHVAATVVRSEVPVDIYAADRIVTLLREKVLTMRHAGARERVWLAGISLGGMTALACAESHRELIDGVVAIAPWPGPRSLWDDVPGAGGIAAWSARHREARFDDERRVWRWLGEGAPGGPQVVIGHGAQDRFAEGQRLLGDALPSEHRLIVDGAHDWPTWRALWQRLLIDLAPRWRSPPATRSAASS
jgi:pimeloyl-ACP methyl ester carboxylesterase